MIGDVADITSRLRRVLPPTWFPSDDAARPVLNALLNGYATQGSFVYDLIVELRKQARLQTATGGFLDVAAADFFGTDLARESRTDEQFRSAILAELLKERVTRGALRQRVQRLTGKLPWVIEPQRPRDTGAYASSLVAATANPSRIGYGIDADTSSYYGSISMRNQIMVIVRRKSGTGIPDVIGYRNRPDALSAGSRAGAYHSLTATTQPGQPSFPLVASKIKWAAYSDVVDFVSDEQVYQAINSVRPAGVTVWVKFEG